LKPTLLAYEAQRAHAQGTLHLGSFEQFFILKGYKFYRRECVMKNFPFWSRRNCWNAS